MKYFITISLILSAYVSHAQVREQKVSEITVAAKRQDEKRVELNSMSIERKAIQEIQPEDLGVLLQKFPGISLKSYGGLGGLKTFSFRSLGSQHSSIVLDGFLHQNAQVGQLNLGQINTNSIDRLQIGNTSSRDLSSISALFGGNEISISTFEGTPHFNSRKIRLSSKVGSFGQYDEYLAVHMSKERFGITFHGKYRRAKGDYPFSLKVLNYTYQGVQKNNELEELYTGASIFFRPNKMKQAIRLIYRNSFIDQGLPGATVLYNPFNKQFLSTKQHALSADWNDKWGLTKVRYYGTYQFDNQIYTDSFYLNQANLLRSEYTQNNSSVGISLSKSKFGDILNFYGGIEQRYSHLKISNNASSTPERWQTFSNVGFKIQERKFLLDLRLGYQLVLERDSVPSTMKVRNLFSPIFKFETKEFGKLNWNFGLFAAATNRLPSFNELYYSQLGNQNLKPEEAKQLVLSNGVSQSFKNWFFTSKVQFYYNVIHNKILAIPTKNLFVWSIQNIGKVHASGVDFVQTSSIQISDKWKVDMLANYSYQKSIDRSSKESPSYGHQIAYIPEHSGNFDVSIYRNKTGLRVSNLFIGERYSLNENVPSNLLVSFYTLDVSIFQEIVLKSKHHVSIQFQIKNIADVSYSYVRSFVMPGRNYLISLNYEF